MILSQEPLNFRLTSYTDFLISAEYTELLLVAIFNLGPGEYTNPPQTLALSMRQLRKAAVYTVPSTFV